MSRTPSVSQLGTILSLFVPSSRQHTDITVIIRFRVSSITDDVTTSELQAVYSEALEFPRIDGRTLPDEIGMEKGEKKKERMLYARQKLGSLASHLLSC